MLVSWTFLGYVESFSEEEVKVILLNNFEAESILEHFGKQNEPSCHITRGALAGNLSMILGKDFVGKEVKCIAKGDNYCMFILKPKKRWLG
ncbi:MAG: hypothetical protein DRO36_01100 [Candidatus Hecatellales archaeon]|nr:MAG: hypothetical protein DRO36_01100 [Candidatus Hecatellales archaeon]